VNIMEIAEGDNGWEVVVDSPYNRRITTTRR
jgi:secreted PhoX family phosphatase